MLLSFIVVTKLNNKEEFDKTLLSIKEQTSSNYELIVVVDAKPTSDIWNEYKILRNKLFMRDNCKLIKNSVELGKSFCWDDALAMVSGKYIKFLDDGEILSPNFVENIEKIVHEKNEPDLIEYQISIKYKIEQYDFKLFLKKDKTYDLDAEYDPISYTSEILFNKIFKTSIVNDGRYRFRGFIRYDMLWVYKVISASKTYIYIEDDINSCYGVKVVDYSLFDVVNQWTHIFNHYRKIGKYNDVKDYLKYAYYKLLVHKWLWILQWEGNKKLIRKAVDFINIKFYDEKRNKFIKRNKVFARKKDIVFQDIVYNLNDHIKDILKAIK